MAKNKKPKIDGINPNELKSIKRVLRQVWSWSYSRKLVVERCLINGGFSRCEECKKKCPKIFVDHIDAVGEPDIKFEFAIRMFVPSKFMQGLCNICHSEKTKAERRINLKPKIKQKRKRVLEIKDFY